MAKFIAHRATWLSHENRLVKEGETFETTFPENMKLSDNIECLEKKRQRKDKPAPDEKIIDISPDDDTGDAGSDDDAGDESTGDNTTE